MSRPHVPDDWQPFRKGYKGTIALAEWEAEELRIRRNQELTRAGLFLARMRAPLAQIFFDGLFGDDLPDGPAGRQLLAELQANEKTTRGG